MSLGDFLLAYRRRTGITQQELADRAHVNVRTVRNIERSAVLRPHDRSVRRLADVIGLSIAELEQLQVVGRTSSRSGGESVLRIDVLGPLSIQVRRQAAELPPPMQRRLLGLLTLRANRVVTQREIVDFLWEEEIPASYLNLVHSHVSRLRKFLRGVGAGEELISRAGGGHRLALTADQCDVLEFGELVARAAAHRARGESEAAEHVYGQALSLWRGQPLADLASLHHPVVVALSQQRLTAVLAYADLALESGRPKPALERLRDVATDEPLHESLNTRILLALAASGERAAALRLFNELRDRFRDELGIDPGPELQDAYARMLRLDIVESRGEPALLDASTGVVPAQLPPDIASFTGRAEQLDMMDAYLSDDRAHPTAARVSVISGTAGVGKTSLAVHWAHRVRHHFPDGQFYYNLHGYSSQATKTASDALTGFLLALGVSPPAVPLDTEARSALLRSLTAGRRMLLVLDNVQSADQVRPLIPANRDSAVVVTSRNEMVGLKVYDDVLTVELDVLSNEEAVTLLTRTIGRGARDTSTESFGELATLCARLPLALRIAAANINRGTHSTVRDYITALREGDRLDELAVDDTTSMAVEAAFALSYAALQPSSARLFRLLGLVPGTDFGSEVAAALIGSTTRQVRPELRRLAIANLVDRSGPGRYRFHDLLRLYAGERALVEESPQTVAEARQRLYDWYLLSTRAAVECSHPHVGRLPLGATSKGMTGASFDDLASASAWLAFEHRNLIAAIHAAVTAGPRPSAWQLIDAMRSHFWASGNRGDWIPAARAAVAAAEEEGQPTGKAAALLSLADAYAFQDRREAFQLYEEALALAEEGGWKVGASSIVNNLGGHYMRFGQLRDAVRCLRRGIELDEEDGRPTWLAVKHVNLGGVYAQLGQLDDAFRHLTRAAQLHPDIDGIIALNIGEICHLRGELDEARLHLERARDRSARATAAAVALPCLTILSEVYRDLGDYETALALGRQALDRSRDLDDRLTGAMTHNALGTLRHRTGRHGEAVEHHRDAIELAGDTYPLVKCAGLLGWANAACALDDAQAMSLAEQALEIARSHSFRIMEGLAHTTLAAITLAAGDHAEAVRQAHLALEIHRETGHRPGEAHTLRTLGDAHTDADAAAYRTQRPPVPRDRLNVRNPRPSTGSPRR